MALDGKPNIAPNQRESRKTWPQNRNGRIAELLDRPLPNDRLAEMHVIERLILNPKYSTLAACWQAISIMIRLASRSSGSTSCVQNKHRSIQSICWKNSRIASEGAAPRRVKLKSEAPQIEPRLNTPGSLAKALSVPLHRVLYMLRTRRHIRPSARAGTLRLFDRRARAMIRHELNATDARRSGGAA